MSVTDITIDQRQAILEGLEEIVKRYSRDKQLWDETREAVLDGEDPIGKAKEVCRLMHIGPLRTNAAKCHDCKKIIVSTNRHDFVTCECGNVSVDGGTWYAKRVFKDGASFDDIVTTWPWEHWEDG